MNPATEIIILKELMDDPTISLKLKTYLREQYDTIKRSYLNESISKLLKVKFRPLIQETKLMGTKYRLIKEIYCVENPYTASSLVKGAIFIEQGYYLLYRIDLPNDKLIVLSIDKNMAVDLGLVEKVMEPVLVIRSNHGNHQSFDRKWELIEECDDEVQAFKCLMRTALDLDDRMEEHFKDDAERHCVFDPESDVVYTEGDEGFEYDSRYYTIVRLKDEERFNGRYMGYIPGFVKEWMDKHNNQQAS